MSGYSISRRLALCGMRTSSSSNGTDSMWLVTSHVHGFTRTFVLLKTIQEFLNGKDFINPDTAVAFGAAVQAATSQVLCKFFEF